MTFENTRKLFLERKQNGEDVIMIRLGIGPDPSNADDFIVEDRLSWFEKEIREGLRLLQFDK